MNAVAEISQQPQQLQVAPSGNSDSQVMMRLIESAMSRPDFDIAKLQELLKVKEQWDANEARKAFVAAMTAFKSEPIDIFKKKTVSFTTRDGDTTSYKHAELSDVTDAVGPAMARHQLSFRWDIHQGKDGITVDCIVTHVLGHSEKVTMAGQPDNSGKKNAIQQAASTVTYLQRYTLLSATGMSTKGDDNDGGGGADPEQPGQPGQQAAAVQQIEMCSPERFEKNRAAWRKLIIEKKKTPAQLVAQIETKGKLSDDQKLTIDSWSHEND